MSYQRLIEDHDGIDRLASQLQLVADADRPDPLRALEILSDLAAAVSEHLSHEDRSVYLRPIQSKRPIPTTIIEDFEEAFQKLRADWETYLADWNTDTISCDWAAFASETEAMIGRLRRRVQDETDLIYPLAMQQGLIQLRSKLTTGTRS